MCTQKPPHDFSQQLYERYREAFNDYIEECVLPALREKKGEYMLKELVRRWDNHKIMVRWLSRFFNYLDRYYIQRHNLAQLKDVGMLCFRELVYTELKFSAKDAVLNLVEHERDGEQIDRALVKNILGIFVEMGMGGMEAYETDFEQNLLIDTAAFYARRANAWIEEDSCPEYLIKVEECLRREKERVGHYLHASSETKLLKEVEKEVLAKYEMRLLEKEHSGCAVLLRDDKTEDLARAFRLFKRVPVVCRPWRTSLRSTWRRRASASSNRRRTRRCRRRRPRRRRAATRGRRRRRRRAPSNSSCATSSRCTTST